MHNFGAYVVPGEVENRHVSPWILLKHYLPSGFYYTKLGQQITGFGICGERPPLAPEYLKPQHFISLAPSSPSSMKFAGLYLSVASLLKLERVDVCRGGPRDSRCTGILLHYQSGKSVALGQWYTDDASHSCIYDNKGPKMSKVCFTMSNAGRPSDRPFVKNVRFLRESPEERANQDRIFDLGQVM
jgi:hypothetical protein